jgi:hypothetical protein
MWTCDLLLLQFQVLEQLLADGLLLQLHPLLPQTSVPNLGVQDAGLGVIELEEGPRSGRALPPPAAPPARGGCTSRSSPSSASPRRTPPWL